MIPFDIKCKSCGSHNVDVKALGDKNLVILCIDCGCCLADISYNPTKFIKGDEKIC